MRGIRGVNDGQQIFSCDVDFERVADEDVKRLFAYQTPALDVGVVMTDELVKTMPQSFSYRAVDNGLCAVALNTYLGRDYMGGAGRFGNYLSHVVLLDRADMTAYPCEYYGSPVLRSSMEFEEVNNPNPPDYLPAPQLVPGDQITVEAVTDFLGVEGRMDAYKKMLRAMLSYEQERKRLVICDEPENILLWIAALEYALPQETALELNFTTYAFDPMLSPAQICGVLPTGTRFTPDTEQNHFTFHLPENRVPQLDADGDFYDFMDTAISYSYSSAQEFHQFLRDGYRYRKADLELCDAYGLYSLLSDGFENVTGEKLRAALEFANRYASPDELRRVMKSFIGRYEELSHLDRELFLQIAEFFSAHAQERPKEVTDRCRELFIDAALSAFLAGNVDEATFVNFFDRIEQYARRDGFSLATELMTPVNWKKLLNIMTRDVSGWKIGFVVRIVSTYVMDKRMRVDALSKESEVGRIYVGLLGAVFKRSAQDGADLVSRVLDEFSKDRAYFAHMALNLDGMLKGLNQPRAVEDMWRHFEQLALSKGGDYLDEACKILTERGAYERAFSLLERECAACRQPVNVKDAFFRHWTLMQNDSRYAAAYADRALKLYYDTLSAYNPAETLAYKQYLFTNIVAPKEKPVAFGSALVQDLTPSYLGKPDEETWKLIASLFRYVYSVAREPLSPHLQLLAIGMTLQGRKPDRLERIETITKRKPVRLPNASKDVEDYFDWIVPYAARAFRSVDGENQRQLQRFLNCFEMTDTQKRQFYEMIGEQYIEWAVSRRDLAYLSPYLDSFLVDGSRLTCEKIGKKMRKIGKPNLKLLNENVKRAVQADPPDVRQHELSLWNEIYRAATAESAIVNTLKGIGSNLTGLFAKTPDAKQRETSSRGSEATLNGEPVPSRERDKRKRDQDEGK